jgi:hypothetical protein
MKAVLLAALAVAVATTASAQAPGPQGVAAWREDIAVARSQFLAKDLSFSAAHRAEADRRLAALSEHVPELTEPEIVAEIARAVALADNAHTRAYLLRNRGWWRRYPVRIWKFSDGWRVVAVRPGYEDLLGGRIVRIGGRAVGDAAAAVRPLYAGVDGWADYMAAYSLTSPDALLGTGVISGAGDAVFEVEKEGRRRVAVAAGPQERRAVPEEAWWFLSPAHAATRGWVSVLKAEGLPAYLSEPDAGYSLRRCAGDVLYVQFNRAQDQGPESLAVFGQRVLGELTRDPAAMLVVDLRFNTGGDMLKAGPLFRGLAATEAGRTPGRLYALVGPATFSAAINHVATLKQNTQVRLAGTEPGDRLEFWAEGGNVTLPNSRINLHYAERAHSYSTHPPPIDSKLLYAPLNVASLKPDLPATLSFAQYARGRDPVAERAVPGGLKCPAGVDQSPPAAG